MASSERLQNEILLKEEAFLKEQRAKLTEQLNKLKVRMFALSWCSVHVFSRMETCNVVVFFGRCDENRQNMYEWYEPISATKHTILNGRSLTETIKQTNKKNTRHVENPDCREAEQLALYKIRLWAWALELKLIYLKELKTVSPTACHLQGSAPPKKCEKLKHLRNVFFHSQQSMQSRFTRCVCTSKQLLVWDLKTMFKSSYTIARGGGGGEGTPP